MGLPLLGKIPIEPKLLMSCEGGKCFVKECPETVTAQSFTKIVNKVSQFAQDKQQQASQNDADMQ